jgi:surfeit locus 1 family protein
MAFQLPPDLFKLPRFPLVPTIVVALCVAAMIAMGVWQLQRKEQKEALLVTLAANFDKPAMAFPKYPVGDQYLFRSASAFCLEPTKWLHEGAGSYGYRLIAECRTGAEGPVLLVDMGTTKDPNFEPAWRGGEVRGTITHAPDHRSLIEGLWDKTPKGLLLVSETPAPGLGKTPKPGLGSVPNNHLAYAVQWFLFALVAAVIYVLALRLRERTAAKAGAPGEGA